MNISAPAAQASLSGATAMRAYPAAADRLASMRVLSSGCSGRACGVSGVVLRLSSADASPVDGLEQHPDCAWHLDQRLAQILKLLLAVRVDLHGALGSLIVLHSIARRLHL